MARPLAFISYSHRHRDWVEALHRNLQRWLEAAGENRDVFLDRADLKSGRSWVAQLQEGLGKAEHLVLVATPEAMASPRVKDEWDAFIAQRPRWSEGRLHVAWLVDTPLPPLLDGVQRVDFRGHDGAAYREALRGLVDGLLGREPPPPPTDVEVPEPPRSSLATDLRRRLISWLEPVMAVKTSRRSVATALGLERTGLEGHPQPDAAASAAVVLATKDDDPLTAAVRIAGILAEELDEAEEPSRLAELAEIRTALDAARQGAGETGLVAAWLDKLTGDHERLIPYFQQSAELDLLDRVYVQLELRREIQAMDVESVKERPDRSWTLRELLDLDPQERPWVTRRWMVLGDPGAGKTTLLRHLAARAAREKKRWVPVLESLPRLMRETGWLLERLERQMRRAGESAEGLAAALERAGQEGRLLVLLDGLDEVPREAREEAESLLRQVAARWPDTPVVVASRPIGYRSPGGGFLELELLPFDDARRREFLARWLGRATGREERARAEQAARELEADSSLRELAGNPLYLTLMALLIEKGTSPARHRPGLYDQVFRLLLSGRHRPAEEPMEHPKATRALLRRVAEAMTLENRDAEPVEDLEARLYQPDLDALRATLERVPRWRRGLRPFLDDLAERTGVLGPHDGPQADWRFWHRTFREALAAEALEERLKDEGEAVVLEHARKIAGDEGRWAEPYALLAGLVDDPDALVRSLVAANRELGLRAVATVQGLRSGTLHEILELASERGKWKERAKVYERIPELLGDPERSLALLDQLRRGTRNGNDLFFLERAVASVARKRPEVERRVTELRERFFDHVPAPPEELFRWIETPHDGRVELWREIPKGSFRMGSPEGVGHGDERPQHEVRITNSFHMAAVTVTNAQFAAFDPGHEPYAWKGIPSEELPHHPVVEISWFAAVAFCRWLGSALPWARGARLPTEEEWEYACRAGTESRYWSGETEDDLARVGWFGEGQEGTTHPVGSKAENPWGLYDVHGNVWEWTASPWTYDYSADKDGVEIDPATFEAADPAAADPSGRRVLRGGSYWNDAVWARSAYRNLGNPGVGDLDQGFRVLLPACPATRSLDSRS